MLSNIAYPVSSHNHGCHTNTQNSISFFSLNARSLFNKMDELRCLDLPHVIAICESWCVGTEPDSIYDLPGYDIIRCDRKTGPGGGVVLYVQSKLNYHVLSNVEVAGFESLWVSLGNPKSSVIVGCTYRPPRANPTDFCTSLEAALQKCHSLSPNIILFGDTNSKHLTWYKTPDLPAESFTDHAGESLHLLTESFGLTQAVHFPTHLHRGRAHSCIDHVFTSFPEGDLHVTSAAPLGNSDHVIIKGQFPLGLISSDSHGNPSISQRWCWSTDRVQQLRDAIREDPIIASITQGHHAGNLDTVWLSWKDTVTRLAKLHCSLLPPVSSKASTQSKHPARQPWIDRNLIQEIKLKHALYRRYLQSRSNTDWNTSRQQSNRVSALLKHAKSEYVSKNLSTAPNPDGEPSSLTNGPHLHSLMRCLLKQKRKAIPELLDGDLRAISDKDKADLLNRFFISQSQQSVSDPSETPPPIPLSPVDENSSLNDIQVTKEEVYKLLAAVDTSKSPGADGVPSKVLKLAALELAPSLTFIFNWSLSSSVLPEEWKEATITPLHKKASRTNPSNYRPISLLSVTSKLLERIVHKRVMEHISPHLPDHQSGFRPQDGTVLQLSRLVHQISADLDASHKVFSCFFDLSKAFDRVWHEGLLTKLEHFGIRGRLLLWFKAYLLHRKQRVRVGTSLSDWLDVPAGVPQGSVLGPLLFLIYTIDLPHACTNSHVVCSQFADDTALIATARDEPTATASLQSSINAAGDWLKAWHLLVNASKTVTMRFSVKGGFADAGHYQPFHLHGVELATVTQHRHLGVILQCDLRWSSHVTTVISKSARLLFLLRRLRPSLTPPAMALLYATYIRPKLEYASNVLSSLSITLSDRLERFQRKAARICVSLPPFQPTHHSALLHQLGWPTLSSRRRYKRLVFAHDMFTKSVPPHLMNLVPPPVHRPSSRLRQHRVFSLPTTRTSHHRDSPIFLPCSEFNCLPVTASSITSKSEFKVAINPLILSSICNCSNHPAVPSFFRF